MYVRGVDLLSKLGVSLKELTIPELCISAADNAGLQAMGEMFVTIRGARGIRTG